MSATLPNIEDLATWLGAALYTTTYRPVNLSVQIACDRKLYSISQSLDKVVVTSSNIQSTTAKNCIIPTNFRHNSLNQIYTNQIQDRSLLRS